MLWGIPHPEMGSGSRRGRDRGEAGVQALQSSIRPGDNSGRHAVRFSGGPGKGNLHSAPYVGFASSFQFTTLLTSACWAGSQIKYQHSGLWVGLLFSGETERTQKALWERRCEMGWKVNCGQELEEWLERMPGRKRKWPSREVELATTFSAGSHGRFLVVSHDGEHQKGSLVPFLGLLRRNNLTQISWHWEDT